MFAEIWRLLLVDTEIENLVGVSTAK